MRLPSKGILAGSIISLRRGSAITASLMRSRSARERVAIAKDLLESPDIALAQVAERAGFGSEESLRHHFRRIAATTPGAYRRAFLVTARQQA
jgi:transcriptional regulator GlxA family with amidase domain